MARPRFCMATILVLSLVILTSAYDYGHDHKPKEKENIVITPNPEYKLEEKEKLDISEIPKSEKPLDEKPERDQPEPEDDLKEKVKPHYEQNPEEEKENHIPKKNYEKNERPEAKEKLEQEYVKPIYEQSKYGDQEKQNLLPIIQNYELPTTIGVKGLVYCKSGLKYSPLPGAVARITCVAIDETTQFSVLSEPCDSKGYFNATVYSKSTIKNCKAYLDRSPMDSCKVPTNINNGISGDLLASNNNILTHHIKLSTVGPFFYTSYEYDHHPLYNKPGSDY